MADEEKIPTSSPQPLRVQLPPRILDIPAVYTNSCNVNLAISDIFITVSHNGQPFQVVNMPYTTAKSLADNLKDALADYEQATGLKIISSKETKEAFGKIPKK